MKSKKVKVDAEEQAMINVHKGWLEEAKRDGVENLAEWLSHRIALDEAKDDDEWYKEANWFLERNHIMDENYIMDMEIEKLEKELAEMQANHKAAWATYGSELCAGEMAEKEKVLEEKIKKLKDKV